MYSYHDYSKAGFPNGGGYQGTDVQKAKLQRSYERKVEFSKCVISTPFLLPQKSKGDRKTDFVTSVLSPS